MNEVQAPTIALTEKTRFWPGIVMMLVTIAIGAAIGFGLGEPQERAAMKLIAFRQNASNADAIAAIQWLTWFGDASQRTVAMVAFAAFMFWRKRSRAAFVMLVVPPLAGAGSSILKEIFYRARPDVVPHLDVISNMSYPSGHATNVMATCLLAALLLPVGRRGFWVLVALLVAFAIGTSRVLLGVHWPSDVVGGWLWGGGLALIGAAVARRMEAEAEEPRFVEISEAEKTEIETDQVKA